MEKEFDVLVSNSWNSTQVSGYDVTICAVRRIHLCFILQKMQTSELLEKCRVLENELSHTTDENYRLTEKRQKTISIVSKIHDGVTAEKIRQVYPKVN